MAKQKNQKSKKSKKEEPKEEIIEEKDEDADERASIENLINETEVSTFKKLRIPVKKPILEQDTIIQETPAITLEEELEDAPLTDQQENIEYDKKSKTYSEQSNIYEENTKSGEIYQTEPSLSSMSKPNQSINPTMPGQPINVRKVQEGMGIKKDKLDYYVGKESGNLQHKTSNPFKKKNR